MDICNIQLDEQPFERTILKEINNLSYVRDNMISIKSAMSMKYVNENTSSSGNGLLFNYNNQNFMLTCSHLVKNNNLTCCSGTNLEGTLNFETFLNLKELDILIFNTSNRELLGINLNRYNPEYNQDSELILNHLNNDNSHSTLNITEHELTNKNIKSNLFPEIPTLCVSVNRRHNIDGYSGSIIKDTDNNPLGMVMYSVESRCEHHLECIYLPFLFKLLIKMIDRNITEFKGVNIKHSSCLIDNNGCDMYANYILEDSCNYTLTDDRQYKFKGGNIILSVDNNDIVSHYGCINCKSLINLDIDLPMNTYLMVATTLNETCYIKMAEFESNSTEEKVRKYLVDGKSYTDIYNNRISDDLNRVIWKGFVFTELSEELLLTYDQKGYDIPHELLETVEQLKSKKIIIVMDIINKQSSIKYKHFSFPMKGDNSFII